MPGRVSDADPLTEALRRIPTAFVSLEVREVLLDHVGHDVLAQVVYDLGARTSPLRTTLAVVHHSGLPLPPPATYERVRVGAPPLAPSEVGRDLEQHRGLRWLPAEDPARRSWPVGRRLVALVGDERSARLVAAHFSVPLVLDERHSPE